MAVTSLGYLTQDEIQTFHKQGYVIKRQAFGGPEMHTLDELTTDMIRAVKAEVFSDKYSISPEKQITYINGSQVVFIKHAADRMSISRVVGCGGIEPRVLQTLRSDAMAMTFFKLLGCNAIEQLICQCHSKLVGETTSFGDHRDIQYRKAFDLEWKDVLGNGSYAVCIIPVDRMTPENGGLFIDKGSYSPQVPVDNVRSSNIDSPTLEPGDLLFMHPYILHWSGPNLSAVNNRRTLLTGFCAHGANHRNYPGTAVNVLLTLEGEKITSRQLDWEQKGTTDSINH